MKSVYLVSTSNFPKVSFSALLSFKDFPSRFEDLLAISVKDSWNSRLISWVLTILPTSLNSTK